MSLLQLHSLLHRAKLLHAFEDADVGKTAAGDLQRKGFLELIAHDIQTPEAETAFKTEHTWANAESFFFFFFAIFV